MQAGRVHMHVGRGDRALLGVCVVGGLPWRRSPGLLALGVVRVVAGVHPAAVEVRRAGRVRGPL